MLPVPELMPFRLTGQFRNLLLPLTDLGPYRIPMTDVLRALRNDSDLLLNTMDIFVHEPLIDWQVIHNHLVVTRCLDCFFCRHTLYIFCDSTKFAVQISFQFIYLRIVTF